jgi:hypothetical protein
MTRIILLSIIIFVQANLFAQKTLTVHFLYGSIPASPYKDVEKKRFGGKKGGHVTIQVGDSLISFQPGGNCHMIAAGNKNGYFKIINAQNWQLDTAGNKYTSIIIPVSDSQYTAMHELAQQYVRQCPYDYAFLGMRCAAASYDLLGETGLLPAKSKTATWSQFFYPQLLRRKLLKLAERNNYTVVRHPGSNRRIWEKE